MRVLAIRKRADGRSASLAAFHKGGFGLWRSVMDHDVKDSRIGMGDYAVRLSGVIFLGARATQNKRPGEGEPVAAFLTW